MNQAAVICEVMISICNAALSKEEAAEKIRNRFPLIDLSDVLPAFRPFIDIGEKHVRTKLKQ